MIGVLKTADSAYRPSVWLVQDCIITVSAILGNAVLPSLNIAPFSMSIRGYRIILGRDNMQCQPLHSVTCKTAECLFQCFGLEHLIWVFNFTSFDSVLEIFFNILRRNCANGVIKAASLTCSGNSEICIMTFICEKRRK